MDSEFRVEAINRALLPTIFDAEPSGIESRLASDFLEQLCPNGEESEFNNVKEFFQSLQGKSDIQKYVDVANRAEGISPTFADKVWPSIAAESSSAGLGELTDETLPYLVDFAEFTSMKATDNARVGVMEVIFNSLNTVDVNSFKEEAKPFLFSLARSFAALPEETTFRSNAIGHVVIPAIYKGIPAPFEIKIAELLVEQTSSFEQDVAFNEAGAFFESLNDQGIAQKYVSLINRAKEIDSTFGGLVIDVISDECEQQDGLGPLETKDLSAVADLATSVIDYAYSDTETLVDESDEEDTVVDIEEDTEELQEEAKADVTNILKALSSSLTISLLRQPTGNERKPIFFLAQSFSRIPPNVNFMPTVRNRVIEATAYADLNEVTDPELIEEIIPRTYADLIHPGIARAALKPNNKVLIWKTMHQ